jgi:predicted RNA-binding protein (virulence factor B family)
MREVALRHADIKVVRVVMTQGVFSVVGVAQSRDVLLALRAAYRADTQWFEAADIPLVQLSGKDGEFPFTMTVVPVGHKKEDKKDL